MNPKGLKMRAVIAGLFSTALLAVAASPAVAAAQRPSIPLANPAALGSQPNVVIHDTVLSGEKRARAAAVSDVIPANAFSGSYAAGGMMIKIAISPSYGADAAEAQSWANFLASLPQHGDAASVQVYFAPLREMQQLCGDDADACYGPNDSVLILLGEIAPDGASIEEVAAHEFGHHIANHRSNAPWSADSWGPKRWATKLHVCQGVRGGTMFPDDQGDNYDRNPTEGWAEAYRVSAGQNPTDWSIVSDIFRPDAATQQIALLDATDPWPGASVSTTSGKLLKGRAKTTKLRISVPQDGRVTVRLTTSRGLNADLDLFNANSRTRVGSSHQRGPSDSVNGTFCGQRSLLARITRVSGSGSFKLIASVPAP